MQLDFINSDSLQGILSLTIEEKDYAENVLSSLKKYQKSMSFPGFRKGRAPIGLVKKQIGDDLLREEVNKLVVDAVTNYMKENDKKFIFQPLAKDTNIDWERDKNFLFEFTLAIKPEFDIDVEEFSQVESYKVVVSEDELNTEIESLQSQYGEIEQLDDVQGGENEVLVFRAVELDEKGEEPLSEGFSKVVRIDNKTYTDKLKKIFVGKKKDQEFDLDIKNEFSSKELESMFDADANMVADLNAKFRINVQGAINLIPAEMTQAFFEKVFGTDDIADEIAFRAKLNESIENRYANRETNRLTDVIKKHLLENVKFELPADYMKEWVNRNEENEDNREQKIEDYTKSARWDLISNKLAEKYNHSVNVDEVKTAIRMRFYSEGMAYYKGQEEIDQMVEQFYGYEGYRLGIEQSILDTKITRSIQDNVTLKVSEISRDAFDEMTQTTNE